MLSDFKVGSQWTLVLGVILIPISVALVSLWSDSRNAERQRELSQQIFSRQERLTVTQTIDTYFEGVGNLLGASMNEATRDRVIVARTRALLARLERPRDSALVVRFVAELRPDLLRRPARVLERSKTPYISLANINLSGTDLTFVNLYNAELSNANLSRANLSWANLGRAELTGANLRGAVLNGSEAGAAILRGANLEQARLEGSGLAGADLRQANLINARPGEFELDDIALTTDMSNANVTGATWFDGHVCGNEDARCTP